MTHTTSDSHFKNGFLKPLQVVSRPDYFEKAVVPHLQNHGKEAMDPVDSAAKAIVKELFPGKKAVFDYGRTWLDGPLPFNGTLNYFLNNLFFY